MDAPHDDRCPRCGDTFHCGMQDAAPCPCSSVRLAPETLAALRRQYTGCLCLRCLAALAAPANAAPADFSPAAASGRAARA